MLVKDVQQCYGKANIWKFVKDLLNEQRKAKFATSERVNEITKMGLQMPKAEDEFYGTDPES